MNAMIDTFSPFLPSLLHGVLLTLGCWVVAAIGGVVLGLIGALLSRSRFAWVRMLIRAYVEALRCTPLLVQLFVVYSGGPSIGITWDALPTGVVVLIVHGSAYFIEIFRGGFQSVPKGHVEAAHSLGMRPLDVLLRVILPEALTSSAPALINMVINICKETALLSIITVPELTFQSQKMAVETFEALPSILTLALCYWFLIEIFSRMGGRLERRINRHLPTKRSA
jgi:polar amino acid transport system permease protein